VENVDKENIVLNVYPNVKTVTKKPLVTNVKTPTELYPCVNVPLEDMILSEKEKCVEIVLLDVPLVMDLNLTIV